MSVVLIDKLLDDFISSDEIEAITQNVYNAHAKIQERYKKNPELLAAIKSAEKDIENYQESDDKSDLISEKREIIDNLKKELTPLGWWTLPSDYDKDEFMRIKNTALKTRSLCDVFLVVGIGGSYLGARAAIDFIKSPNYNAMDKDTPDIYFTGNSISPTAINELIEICRDKDVCINVISKSGETTETALAFRI
ncbi:MAG: hypothetical protein PHZ09_06265, partial [Eubacteriales bacterium]|nr:hypothetical protein [Eubacteriales bacterium]